MNWLKGWWERRKHEHATRIRKRAKYEFLMTNMKEFFAGKFPSKAAARQELDGYYLLIDQMSDEEILHPTRALERWAKERE